MRRLAVLAVILLLAVPVLAAEQVIYKRLVRLENEGGQQNPLSTIEQDVLFYADVPPCTGNHFAFPIESDTFAMKFSPKDICEKKIFNSADLSLVSVRMADPVLLVGQNPIDGIDIIIYSNDPNTGLPLAELGRTSIALGDMVFNPSFMDFDVSEFGLSTNTFTGDMHVGVQETTPSADNFHWPVMDDGTCGTFPSPGFGGRGTLELGANTGTWVFLTDFTNNFNFLFKTEFIANCGAKKEKIKTTRVILVPVQVQSYGDAGYEEPDELSLPTGAVIASATSNNSSFAGTVIAILIVITAFIFILRTRKTK